MFRPAATLCALTLAVALPAAAQTAPASASAPESAPAAAPAPPPPKLSAAECEVWNRERSFARSVEAHDAAAFRAHLHPGTVFISGPGEPLRGPDVVVREWADIIAGEKLVLRWHPRFVVIGGEPDIAHSRGPYWMENPDPKAPSRYAIGQFTSVWKRVDGEWKILFDGGGGGRPEPATAEQVEALKASLDAECPHA